MTKPTPETLARYRAIRDAAIERAIGRAIAAGESVPFDANGAKSVHQTAPNAETDTKSNS